MRCNNVSLNNFQGHPGKEGPPGEKGHMVSYISFLYFSYFWSLLTFVLLRIYFSFSTCLSSPSVLLQTHLHKTFCINVDNSRAASACVYCSCMCVRQALTKYLSPQGPAGPQGPIGYPGPRGVKVRLLSTTNAFICDIIC